ncbi:hypothetical protein SERLADRAFT_363593 [Serpula lacrymans var. lacrymans S7.9]|uniref:Pseudouridine synthase I TruA alpha/beta domain-containing protein n=1 Tax=Serpula lacrymans var. lacrymans (strain S7.9) TaxID=578457 RepID=F8P967_SERL9|nr:uncharacterized protein SERLADRAFT_363593 [Serpula lacrymans var. lacrymans S7.9]EGO20196.1 hypothetical protein SERLADRAFT_363593 [Serpula lacrymans var. lacrymans S7.9]
MSPEYQSWTKEQLIARLNELESYPQASASTKKTTSSTKITTVTSPQKKTFDFTSHPRRKIAVKFCYSGWEYNGLAFQNGPTPLPTVEEVLFNAFAKTRLVDPDKGLDGCGWERCGRTDRGVSAAGQVVSLWVRSALDENRLKDAETRSELRYVSILNRVLPPTIRVLAWSPISSTFSARFNCQSRHYKYFFSPQELDLGLMQQAADRLVGEHDFRNLCKLDPAKQITNFNRRVLLAKISPISDHLCVFDLRGTAFLYHQVRHIMAILFLVGTGLEHPSIVSTLLNVGKETNSPSELDNSPLEIVDRKPEYQMADGLPLMLWDCAYSDSDVQWQTDIDTGENAHFLSAAAQLHSHPPQRFPFSHTGLALSTIPVLLKSKERPVLSVPLGGGTFKRTAKYIPVLLRKRLDHVEVANERWRVGKGERREERKNVADGIPQTEYDGDE